MTTPNDAANQGCCGGHDDKNELGLKDVHATEVRLRVGPLRVRSPHDLRLRNKRVRVRLQEGPRPRTLH